MGDAPRIAMLSVHTSPLDQPGTGDAGGMNVYVTELARALAARGAAVEIFTRATEPGPAETVEMADGVTVRHIDAGPRAGVEKGALPDHMPAFTAGLLCACRGGRGFDVVHSHYWLSGLVGRDVVRCWDAPLVHTMHTLAKVKNASLAPGDRPEPARRIRGEEEVVAAAHALVVSARQEAADLVHGYGADPEAVHVVEPGVDRDLFHPGTDVVDARHLAAAQRRARAAVGLDPDEQVVLFAGRVQPLKGPDVLIRAIARLADLGGRVPRLVMIGGPSGSPCRLSELEALVDRLGIAAQVDLRPPLDRSRLAEWYRAADVVAVPSRSESFGLVAAEAQACGTPVVAAGVGGLCSVVDHDTSGLLVPSHDPATWAHVLRTLLADPGRRGRLGVGAYRQAAGRGWDTAADAMLAVYAGAVERRRQECAAA
jgi:D-inositol-3-phosphate glycosyltransferase